MTTTINRHWEFLFLLIFCNCYSLDCSSSSFDCYIHLSLYHRNQCYHYWRYCNYHFYFECNSPNVWCNYYNSWKVSMILLHLISISFWYIFRMVEMMAFDPHCRSHRMTTTSIFLDYSGSFCFFLHSYYLGEPSGRYLRARYNNHRRRYRHPNLGHDSA